MRKREWQAKLAALEAHRRAALAALHETKLKPDPVAAARPWHTRLFELLEALADDLCRGWPLEATDVDTWLQVTGITWNELVDWMHRRGFVDLVALG